MKEKNNSLFSVLLLNKEIDKRGKHILKFSPELPLVIREYNFEFEFPVKPNFHDYLEIICILKNKAIIQYGEKKYDVEKGDILIIGKNEFHNCFQYKNEPIGLISLKFLSEMIYNFGGHDIDFEYLRPFFSKSPNFQNLLPNGSIDHQKILEKIYYIKTIVKRKEKHYKIKAKNVLNEILLSIVEFYDDLPAELFDQHSKYLQDLKRLKKVFELLNTKYNEKIPLMKAAEVACLSETYFSRFFKKVTGSTYSSYLQKIRVEKAKELLINEDFSIIRIAFLTGFNTLSFFNKTFKKYTKLTPLSYRKNSITK